MGGNGKGKKRNGSLKTVGNGKGKKGNGSLKGGNGKRNRGMVV